MRNEFGSRHIHWLAFLAAISSNAVTITIELEANFVSSGDGCTDMSMKSSGEILANERFDLARHREM